MSRQVVGKKPAVEYNIYPYPIYSCPRSGDYVMTTQLYRASYCSDCGQKIDWDSFPPLKPQDNYADTLCYDWRSEDQYGYEKSIMR